MYISFTFLRNLNINFSVSQDVAITFTSILFTFALKLSVQKLSLLLLHRCIFIYLSFKAVARNYVFVNNKNVFEENFTNNTITDRRVYANDI